jgi:5'-phosphate synthase pdxT subunit
MAAGRDATASQIPAIRPVTIGVLALQGDFQEHCESLRAVGVTAVEVRLPVDLEPIDGFIIPGGESTTISKLMRQFDMVDAIHEFARNGRSVWGTCAGMIVIARNATDLAGLDPLGLIDIDARRNAFGRQVDSFEEDLPIAVVDGTAPFRGVFIRAPSIERIGTSVEILATGKSGAPAAVRQGAILATTFHPELTTDTRFHDFFARITEESRSPVLTSPRPGEALEPA